MAKITLTVNGEAHEVDTDLATPLLFVLRNQLGLTGAKLGCGLEQCGACAILINGEPVLSCVRAVSEFKDDDIRTVEGLAKNNAPSAVQQAFIDHGAAQCGYCTAGLVVATTALLKRHKNPDRSTIDAALTDHLCRCGSHLRVLKAIDTLISEGASHD
ncbi:MAG: 2Fe-2S iron-sulfur cluster binding domain-containing protein [Alphaproteobacteria bacterium]|nr:2Fe-2S iron-sulfur cluster binding domain-containing protein [Alphaproteobacteria bacterium]